MTVLISGSLLGLTTSSRRLTSLGRCDPKVVPAIWVCLLKLGRERRRNQPHHSLYITLSLWVFKNLVGHRWKHDEQGWPGDMFLKSTYWDIWMTPLKPRPFGSLTAWLLDRVVIELAIQRHQLLKMTPMHCIYCHNHWARYAVVNTANKTHIFTDLLSQGLFKR